MSKMFSTMHNSIYFIFSKAPFSTKINFNIQAYDYFDNAVYLCDYIGPIWIIHNLLLPGSMTQSQLHFCISKCHTHAVLWLGSCIPEEGVIPPTTNGPIWPLYIFVLCEWPWCLPKMVYRGKQLKDKNGKINYWQNLKTLSPKPRSDVVK